jgi:hypothetical protein
MKLVKLIKYKEVMNVVCKIRLELELERSERAATESENNFINSFIENFFLIEIIKR